MDKPEGDGDVPSGSHFGYDLNEISDEARRKVIILEMLSPQLISFDHACLPEQTWYLLFSANPGARHTL